MKKVHSNYQTFETTTEYFKTFLKSSLLISGTKEIIFEKNTKKGHFHFLKLSHLYKADKVYFLDKTGTTVIASDWKFFRKNYEFRPYFLYAMRGKINYYIARGVTTGQIGVYFGFPVYDKNNKDIIGVLVFKYNLSKFLDLTDKENVMLMHESGLVIYGPDDIENSCIYCNEENAQLALRNYILGNQPVKKTKYKIIKDRFLCRNGWMDNQCRLLLKFPLMDSDYSIVGIYHIAPFYDYKNKLLLYWVLSSLLLSITLFEVIRKYQ